MINKTKKILILSVILGIVFLVLPYTSNAAGEGVMQGVAISMVNSAIANIANFFLMFAASVVFWTGILLSISVRITTNIGALYTSITGIQSVWVTIRDLSSIFIIFSLLYYSIRTILGISGTSINQQIVKIFLAGVLINFSLFFVRVAVDASNLISLQFYNAITPSSSAPLTDFTNLSFVASTENLVKDASGLSNVFMQSLKLPKIYQNTGILKSSDVTASIGFAAIGGIMMMVIAALSFLAASLAFIIRTAILLGIMALSPLYFVGMIFPEIKVKVSNKMRDYLYNQCVFMPVYFFLLYVSLRIISDDGFMKIFNQNAVSGTGSSFGAISISTIIQYTIAIVFINLPLLAAIELGGQGMKWAPQAKDIAGILGRNTLGRAGKKLGEKFDDMAISSQQSALGRGASSVLSNLGISRRVRGGIKAIEEGKYGASENLGQVKKIYKERDIALETKSRQMNESREVDKIIGNKVNSLNDIKNVKTILSKMNSKEMEGLGKKLSDPYVAGAMSSRQAENIMKSSDMTDKDKEEFMKSRATGLKIAMKTINSGDFEAIMKEDFNDEQKKDLKENRTKTFEDLVGKGSPDEIKDYMKNLSGKELAKMDPAILQNMNVMDNYTGSQLKEMTDLNRNIKKVIGDYIDVTGVSGNVNSNHPALGFILKNKVEWS